MENTYSQPPPPFGHAMLEHFALDPEYINLNHGSYGTTPKPVLNASITLMNKIESNPDKFHRIQYQAGLIEARTKLANLVGAHTDECVLVANATTGVNTVLRNFDWDGGDLIIAFSTSYHAISRTVHYISDIPPHPKLSIINLSFPNTHNQIVEQFVAHLRSPETQVGPNNKRVAVIDSIISNPGVLLPWKEMVKICKEEGVWSVIDAAHSIGQEVGLNLGEAGPDFWISNCHKWLYAKRSCAILYVPFRNQHIIKSSFPTSNSYISPARRNGKPNFVEQFEWNGTIDFAPFLSVLDALDFRAWLGGEEKINSYCHDLAVKGGQRLAEVLGTTLLDPEAVLTLNMVNVELPFPFSVPFNLYEQLNHKLLEKKGGYSAFFPHNGKWWTRCSAQVFNEVDDFEKLGQIWLEVCKEVLEEVESEKTIVISKELTL